MSLPACRYGTAARPAAANSLRVPYADTWGNVSSFDRVRGDIPRTRSGARFGQESYSMNVLPDALYIGGGIVVMIVFALYAIGLRRISS